LEKELVVSGSKRKNENLEIYKQAGKKTLKGIADVFYGLSLLAVSPAMFPGAVRKMGDLFKNVDSDVNDFESFMGVLAWGSTAFTINMGLFHIYGSKIASALLATNAASGIYEYFRHNKNKLIKEKQPQNKLQLKENGNKKIS